jgi:hypothetical protein
MDFYDGKPDIFPENFLFDENNKYTDSNGSKEKGKEGKEEGKKEIRLPPVFIIESSQFCLERSPVPGPARIFINHGS